jgi:hypothetical protein
LLSGGARGFSLLYTLSIIIIRCGPEISRKRAPG